MLENIFITGTASKLVLNLGNCKEYVGQMNYYHAVSSSQPKSVHVSHLSAYVAPLICSYAKSNLNRVDTILVCLKIPALLPYIEQDKENLFTNVFQVEWFFSLDMIKNSLKLFDYQKGISDTAALNKQTKGKMYICIPHMLRYQLNDLQRIYYNSILCAVKTLTKVIPCKNELAIILTRAALDNNEHEEELLALIDSLREKRTHRRIFYMETLPERFKKYFLKTK